MYSKINSGIWYKKEFNDLTINDKLFYIYLFSNKHRNLAGFYSLPISYIGFDLKLSENAVKTALKSLCDKRFIYYDWNNSLILIKSFIKYNQIQNINMMKSVVSKLKELEKSYLFLIFDELVKKYAEQYYDYFAKNLKHYLDKNLYKPYDKPFNKPFNKPIDKQYSKQEKEEGEEKEEVEEASIGQKEFDAFWRLYPHRDNIKRGKKKSLDIFKRIIKSKTDFNKLLIATKNYSKTKTVVDGFAKDPERFLKNDFWEDFIDIKTSDSPKIYSPYNAQIVNKIKKIENEIETKAKKEHKRIIDFWDKSKISFKRLKEIVKNSRNNFLFNVVKNNKEARKFFYKKTFFEEENN